MTKTNVKAHTRGKDDPFAPVIEAKRARFCRKWGVELISANDDRLAKPIADPVPGPGRFSLFEHNWLIRSLARLRGAE